MRHMAVCHTTSSEVNHHKYQPYHRSAAWLPACHGRISTTKTYFLLEKGSKILADLSVLVNNIHKKKPLAMHAHVYCK